MTPLPAAQPARSARSAQPAHAAPAHAAPEPVAWWRQAWALVLAGGIVMGLALGVRHVQGLFFLPVTMDRGWSRETFGLAPAEAPAAAVM